MVVVSRLQVKVICVAGVVCPRVGPDAFRNTLLLSSGCLIGRRPKYACLNHYRTKLIGIYLPDTCRLYFNKIASFYLNSFAFTTNRIVYTQRGFKVKFQNIILSTSCGFPSCSASSPSQVLLVNDLYLIFLWQGNPASSFSYTEKPDQITRRILCPSDAGISVISPTAYGGECDREL